SDRRRARSFRRNYRYHAPARMATEKRGGRKAGALLPLFEPSVEPIRQASELACWWGPEGRHSCYPPAGSGWGRISTSAPDTVVWPNRIRWPADNGGGSATYLAPS